MSPGLKLSVESMENHLMNRNMLMKCKVIATRPQREVTNMIGNSILKSKTLTRMGRGCQMKINPWISYEAFRDISVKIS